MVEQVHSTQSAMKTSVSPCFAALRLEQKTIFLPSSENIGKPSKASLNVTRSIPEPYLPLAVFVARSGCLYENLRGFLRSTWWRNNNLNIAAETIQKGHKAD